MSEIKDEIKKLEDEIFELNNTKNNIIDKNDSVIINIIFPFLMSLLMSIIINSILIVNSFFSVSSVSLTNAYLGVIDVYNFLMIVISSVCVSFGSVISILNYLDYKKDLEKIKEIDVLLIQLSNDIAKIKKNKLELNKKTIKSNERSNNINFSKVKYFNENLIRDKKIKNNKHILVKRRNLA